MDLVEIMLLHKIQVYHTSVVEGVPEEGGLNFKNDIKVHMKAKFYYFSGQIYKLESC